MKRHKLEPGQNGHQKDINFGYSVLKILLIVRLKIKINLDDYII